MSRSRRCGTLRVQRDDVPGTEVVAVVALVRFAGPGSRSTRSSPWRPASVFVVARHRVGDVAERTPVVGIVRLEVGQGARSGTGCRPAPARRRDGQGARGPRSAASGTTWAPAPAESRAFGGQEMSPAADDDCVVRSLTGWTPRILGGGPVTSAARPLGTSTTTVMTTVATTMSPDNRQLARGSRARTMPRGAGTAPGLPAIIRRLASRRRRSDAGDGDPQPSTATGA